MNILIYPQELVVGGSQINAIELAGAVRDRGHDVVVTAPSGALVPMIESLGLDYIPTPVVSTYPSVATIEHLIRVTRKRKFDLIHCYEWRPSIEAVLGPHLFSQTPVIMTVLSMQIPYALPRHIPMILGTAELVDKAPHGRSVWLMEPPIDTIKNCSMDSAAARARWSFRDDDIVAAVVCRLTTDLEKLHGVLAAIYTVSDLAEHLPLKLLVAGDGEGLGQVRRAAEVANRRWDRQIVTVTGLMLNPHDAYEASDIVLGMGSSALKGMAFAKPLVVQGASGFWRLLDEASVELFLRQGWFGNGGNGADDLKAILSDLAADPDRRSALGRFGRTLVEQRFSLDNAATRLIEMYKNTIDSKASMARRLPSITRLAVELTKLRTVTGLRASREAVAKVLEMSSASTANQLLVGEVANARQSNPLPLARILRVKPVPQQVPVAKVTVIIPCYNYARFLPAAVQSALSQGGAEVSVIVVDDASTDESLKTASELAASDPRVTVVAHQTNLGPVQTFNDGLALARGEFLVRLDADDLLTPGSLLRASAVMHRYPSVGLVYGYPLHFAGDVLPTPRQQPTLWTIWPGRQWLAARCHSGKNVITSPEVMMRRSVVEQIGGQQPLDHTHDMEMWLRLSAFSDVAYIHGSDQAWHREHVQSLSAREVDSFRDLVERRAAYEILFAGSAGQIPEAAVLRADAMMAIAANAVELACRQYDHSVVDAKKVQALRDIACSLVKSVDDIPGWKGLERRMAIGSGRAAQNPVFFAERVVRGLRSRYRHWRWHRTGEC